MSHATCLVILPKGTSNASRDIKQALDTLLAPYDENKDVPEYDRTCHCVGNVARRDAMNAATERFGPIENTRTAFWAGVTDEERQNPFSKELDRRWTSFIKERMEYEQSAFEAHPMKDQPDPTCGFYTEEYFPEGRSELIGVRFEDESGCGGTGMYRSTYNPCSKWDWWVIGGRYHGRLSRDGDGPNVMPVMEITKEEPTFALVTPDGEWHQSARLGWFGTSSDEQDPDRWRAEYYECLSGHPRHLAVLIDYHI